jgi:hypothetical protein
MMNISPLNFNFPPFPFSLPTFNFNFQLQHQNMSSSDLPSSHRALVVNTQQTGWVVKEQPLPIYDPITDVLVRVHAVALNPTDWKHLAAIKPGGSVGSDFGGVVCRGGGGYEVGDRVAGFTRGGYLQFDNGAFAGKSVRVLLC